MIPRPAQYLLRFDDFCPTMSLEKWESFLPIIAEFGLRPILAVVPDNQDPDLMVSSPDPKFWDRMRSMEAAGATIAMHGFRHLCASSGKGLVRLHRNTEFAGVSEEQQQKWIREGLAILRGHGLSPRIFVAPRHGFDFATLRALSREGLGYLSDGFARRPFVEDEIVCIPQQLWEPVQRSKGLWTICVHSNTATSLAERLRSFVQGNATQFTSFDRVLAEYEPCKLRWSERLSSSVMEFRKQFAATMK
jgi:predicted deacetylase